MAHPTPTRTTDTARARFGVRTAWRWLLAPAIVIVLFGIGDIIGGASVDPAIFEGLTGTSLAALEEQSPQVARFVDFQTRAGGMQLIVMGLALSAIIVFGFRRWELWAWYSVWLVPVWALSVSMAFILFDRPAGGPVPPPMVSGFVFFAYAAYWLIVSHGGFDPDLDGTD